MEENSKDLTQKDKDLMIIMELVIEMLCRGIRLAPVDLYQSDATKFQVVNDKLIRMPFNALPGLGEAAARAVAVHFHRGFEKPHEDIRVADRSSAGGRMSWQSAGQQSDDPVFFLRGLKRRM